MSESKKAAKCSYCNKRTILPLHAGSFEILRTRRENVSTLLSLVGFKFVGLLSLADRGTSSAISFILHPGYPFIWFVPWSVEKASFQWASLAITFSENISRQVWQ